jgi:2-dehydro-3-deoxyphosphogluconate aldolase/(4S)-4-hydroxy-2-oxoglutarate aldolase
MLNKAIETIINSSGIIAISRGNYGEGLVRAAEALVKGGVKAVEVTFEQDKDPEITAEAIRSLVDAFGEKIAVGAGTVLTAAQLQTAKQAGARYIVSPNSDEKLITETKRLGLGSIPGAMTPTEIVRASDAGADIVKIFPAGVLGPAYFSAVTTPLAHIRCAAVAGITPENIAAFKKAGACAFGISSTLFNKKLIASKRFDEITAAAAAFTSALGD